MYMSLHQHLSSGQRLAIDSPKHVTGYFHYFSRWVKLESSPARARFCKTERNQEKKKKKEQGLEKGIVNGAVIHCEISYL